MKKNLLLLGSYILALGSANAQTNVSGFISANTTWNLAGSPYVVVGNALLSIGYTLTIDPGVVVKFDNNKTIQIDGQLIAIGTSAQRITFTANQTTPTAGYWGAIHFSSSAPDATFDAGGNYLSGCIMKYCDVMYGGSTGTGQIHIVNTYPYFSQCRIMYSGNDGIYCEGTCRIDSSVLKNCIGAGLSVNNTFPACGLIMQSDSILNNAMGGIYYNSATPCSTTVRGNYFSGNLSRGGFFAWGGYTMKITDNYFFNNTASIEGGIVYAVAQGALISGNSFVNNHSTVSGGAILIAGGFNDTIECNNFISNQTGVNGTGAVSMTNVSNGIIRNNLFDGNFNNNYSVCVSYVSGITASNFTFTGNTVRNNSCPSGKCCVFVQQYLNSQPMHNVHHNDFTNNVASNVIYVTLGAATASTTPFFNLKHNNLINPSSQYELYNNVPYGSPNLYVDSNYWGSTNTQHIDSVIYDYFDDATKSVVYYPPILNSPVTVDTTCLPLIITTIKNIEKENFISTLFPNPFTTTATIKFSRAVHAATLRIYNMYGQLVAESSNINGESFQVNAEGFGSGVYVYEVTEKEKRICGGKAVVY